MIKKSKNFPYSNKKKFKIALVHDYIKEFGGAESVLETLSDIFPDAPIYTSLYLPQFLGPHRQRLEQKWQGRIKTSFFQKIPFSSKIISILRIISPLAFQSFDFSQFDFIISSATGAYFPNSLNKKSAKLFCYCHTPPRYLYGLPTARNYSKNPILRPIISFMNYFLKIADKKYSHNVNQYIANSITTANRIKKFYHREAIVINPPITLSVAPLSKRAVRQSEGFYLTGGRLARAKRYDIAIKACNQLGLKLKVFGRDFANYLPELEAIAGPTIEFVGEVDDKTKQELYSNCQAFIFCADNEDFGMMPVEAMARGCPVIAYKSGGVTETVIDGKTGILFKKLTPNSCVSAIQKLDKTKINSSACITQSKTFSKEVFIQKIKNLFN
jgi:glycosyltransferase involved in cell wall biosynthesis